MKNLKNILIFILNHPLGKKQKIKTLFRFFYWQIFSRLKIAKNTFTFVNKTKLYISKGQTVATGNFYVGLLEFSEMAFTSHFLDKNDVFFDVGANIGTFSVLASGIANAKTFSFEPIPETYKILKDNIKLNNLQNKITAINTGIADKEGKIKFTKSLKTKNHIANDKEKEETITVNVTTLNKFSEFKPSLIKIDVEGYEKFVLNGATQILESEMLKAVIIEVNNESERYNVTENSIHNILSSFGFKMYEYNPFKRNLYEISETEADNRIYIRDYEYVIKKLRKSEKINVIGLSF